LSTYQKIYRVIQPQALWILILFHIVGLIGITVIDLNLFAGLSALNLLLSAFLIYVDHEGSYKKFWRLFGIVFLIGYFIELIGITTGYPFGIYEYGLNLGPKLLGVPVVIGVNWFLLTISCGFVSQHIFENRKIRLLSAALLMVFIDFLIEPVSDELGYWFWADGYVPARNYLGWFVVAYITQVVFQKTVSTHINNIAVKYFFIVLGFFILLNLFI
jgi:putative membrane protein